MKKIKVRVRESNLQNLSIHHITDTENRMMVTFTTDSIDRNKGKLGSKTTAIRDKILGLHPTKTKNWMRNAKRAISFLQNKMMAPC